MSKIEQIKRVTVDEIDLNLLTKNATLFAEKTGIKVGANIEFKDYFHGNAVQRNGEVVGYYADKNEIVGLRVKALSLTRTFRHTELMLLRTMLAIRQVKVVTQIPQKTDY